MPRSTQSPRLDARTKFTSIITNASFLTGVFPSISIDSPVVPGQPIPLTLGFFTYNRTLDLGRGTEFKVFLGKDLLIASPADGSLIPYIPSALRTEVADQKVLID